MKNSRYWLTAVSLLGLWLSCSQAAKDPAQTAHDAHAAHAPVATPERTPAVAALEKEVLAIHDQLMPKMGELMALKKQARQLLLRQESLQTSQDSTQLQTLIRQLEAADAAMMDWMHHYDGKLAGQADSDKLKYLEAEKKKITWVRTLMLVSLAQGRQLLGKRSTPVKEESPRTPAP